MEAASIPVRATRANSLTALRTFANRYGLIIVLLAMPLAFMASDLAAGHGFTHILQNLKDGVSNGAIWALIAIGYTQIGRAHV